MTTTTAYLVDDHAMVREGLRAVLERAGLCVVGETGDPTQALADVVRLEPRILLLDLNLGQRSGFELLERMQQRKLATRAIVLTMSEQPRDVAQALRLGARGYVRKGSSARDVLAAVQAVADGHDQLAQHAASLAPDHDADSDALAALSMRERQVLLLVVRGQTSAVIAEQLHLSPKTVDSYRSRLMAKLGVGDLPALVRLAIREKLISAEEA